MSSESYEGDPQPYIFSCSESDIEEHRGDSFDVGLDTTGFAFLMNQGTMSPCSIRVPYSRIIPLLNEQGKAAVKSIQDDLAKLPTLAK